MDTRPKSCWRKSRTNWTEPFSFLFSLPIFIFQRVSGFLIKKWNKHISGKTVNIMYTSHAEAGWTSGSRVDPNWHTDTSSMKQRRFCFVKIRFLLFYFFFLLLSLSLVCPCLSIISSISWTKPGDGKLSVAENLRHRRRLDLQTSRHSLSSLLRPNLDLISSKFSSITLNLGVEPRLTPSKYTTFHLLFHFLFSVYYPSHLKLTSPTRSRPNFPVRAFLWLLFVWSPWRWFSLQGRCVIAILFCRYWVN